jgi:hypothetical protein
VCVTSTMSQRCRVVERAFLFENELRKAAWPRPEF